MSRAARNTEPIGVVVPKLMAERQLSLTLLAAKANVSKSHLSRVLRGADDKTASTELLHRLADALDVPTDYFIEYRETVVVEAVRRNPELRDRIYGRLRS